MKIRSANFGYRRDERGQTLALVALSIVALLGFAALAIDVATLYVAHSEVQRAADAAALAGAKVIADSGITSLQTTDANYATLQSSVQLAATTEIAQLIALRNQVAGGPVSRGRNPTYIQLRAAQRSTSYGDFAENVFAGIFCENLGTALSNVKCDG